MSMAQVLRRAVAAHVGWGNKGEREPIALSLGVTVYDRQMNEDTLEQEIHKADTELYTAKSKGRNQVQCSAPRDRERRNRGRCAPLRFCAALNDGGRLSPGITPGNVSKA
jgi:predicted signal transduction protein with EAL and GGDEF domain